MLSLLKDERKAVYIHRFLKKWNALWCICEPGSASCARAFLEGLGECLALVFRLTHMALSLRIALGLTLYSAISLADPPEARARAERTRHLSEAFRAAIGDTSPRTPEPRLSIDERAIQMMEFLDQFPDRDPNGPGLRERRLSDPNTRRSTNVEDRRTWEHFGELFDGSVTYYRDAAGNYFAVPRGGGTRQVRRDQIPGSAVGRKDGKVAPSSGNGVATLPEKTKGESSGATGGSKGGGWRPSDPTGNPGASKGGGESQTKGSSSSDRSDSGKSGSAPSGELSKESSGSSSSGGSKSQSGSSSSSSKSTSSTKK